MGRKVKGLLCPLFGVGAGSPSNTMLPGPTSLPSGILIHPAVWPQQTWAENWGTVPLWGMGSWVSSNTMWPGPRPISMPSFVLVRPTVWPQYCAPMSQDRIDRQTGNGPIA